MFPRADRSKGLLVAGVVTMAVLFFLRGFGLWGLSVWGDNALDLADALRFSQGDVPYRDFIPTYGPLHMVLAAPLFWFGRGFFPAYWSVTFLLLMAQMLALMWVVQRGMGFFWSVVGAMLFLACIAFAPVNAQLMQGYSPSGFLGTLGWTLCLFLLWRAPVSNARWLAVGAVLGLQLFTKMDTGLTALACLVALMAVLSSKQLRPVLFLTVGFALSWWGGLAGVIACGGTMRLIVETTLEGMGQAGIFGDPELKCRMLGLLGMGAVFGIGLVLPLARRMFLRFYRGLRPWAIWLLPVALMMDAWRGWPSFSLKNMVALNYFGVLVWVLVTARLAAAVLRRRSLRALRFPARPALLLMWLVAGTGIARAAITGWYPLNYYQPAVLILVLTGCATVSADVCGRRMFRGALLAGACAVLMLVWHRLQQPIYPATWLPTRYGAVAISVDEIARRELMHVLTVLQQAPEDESILCTYEPSVQLLAGMRSAAFYTYFGRVGFSGKYQPEREKQSLEFFMKRRPLFVLHDRERAVFSRFFGADHSRELSAWIEAHYDKVYSAPSDAPMQMQLYRRRD